MSKLKKPRLGRGLSGLMSSVVSVQPPEVQEASDAPVAVPASASEHHPSASQAEAGGSGEGLVWIDLDAIEANPYQPRRTFDEASLNELAASIRQAGVMQPVILRPTPGGGAGRYQLVAGERRWRAARRAALERIPAVVRSLNDEQIAEWAVIENLQREDLNAIERAEAFARLIQQFNLRHEDVAERIGINRVTVTNILRLLDLPDSVQELIRLDKLSAGHGRAIATLDDPLASEQLARRALAGGWSVRQVEQAVKELTRPIDAPTPKRDTREAHYADLERRISSQLKMRTHIKPGRKKGTGTLEIDFHGLDAFDTLMQRLGVELE